MDRYQLDLNGNRTLCLVVFALIGLTLSGCAAKPTVSEFQCLAGDWETIGYRDGAAGLPSTRLLNHAEACGPHGVVPERNTYLAGWENGLASYCTPSNGFQLGSQGRRQHGLCDQNFGGEFAAAYQEGLTLYRARAAVAEARQAVHHAEQRLADIKEEIIDVSAAQLQPDLTAVERVELVADLNRLVEERVELKQSLPYLVDTLQEKEAEFARQQQLVAYSS